MILGFSTSISVASSELDVGVLHQRLGHISEKGMKVMLSKDKLPGLKSIDLDFCEVCFYEKQWRVIFSKIRKTLKAEKFELVHTDVWGKALVFSLGNSLYFVTFIDDSSRKVWVYFLKHNRMCSMRLRNDWPKLRMNQVGSLSAWSSTTGANTVIANSKSSARVGESEKWGGFPKTLIRTKRRSAWKWPLSLSMPGACGYTLDCPSNSGKMQSTQCCIWSTEEHRCLWIVGFHRKHRLTKR